MGLLIDADVLIRLERSGGKTMQLLEGHAQEQIFLSVVTVSELLHGVWRAPSPAVRQRRQDFVEALLAIVPILDIDIAVARVHAKLWADLAADGQMIGLHDSWIAAVALAHQLTVVTGNIREFSRIPELRFITLQEAPAKQ